MSKDLLFFVMLATLLASCEQGETPEVSYQSEYVIVVVMDGPRHSETWGDTNHSNIPNLANKMLSQGVLVTDFFNKGETYTVPGHASILTGIYQDIKNSGQELPRDPSIFQYWLEASKQDSSMAWILASKDKLESLSDCLDPAWQGRYRPATDCGVSGAGSGYRHDSLTLARTIEILSAYHPKLVLVSFREPDYTAHLANWDQYLRQIQQTDAYIYRLWDFIRHDSVYSDKTALFVTNDHGRHLDSIADGFVSHGDDCTGCRRISLLAMGPDFKRGQISAISREQIDIAPTIARLFGFEIPNQQGEVMTELFE